MFWRFYKIRSFTSFLYFVIFSKSRKYDVKLKRQSRKSIKTLRRKYTYLYKDNEFGKKEFTLEKQIPSNIVRFSKYPSL